MGSMRGAALQANLGYVRKQFGEAGVQKVLAGLSAETRKLVDSHPRGSQMIPTAAIMEVAQVADRLLGKGDLALVEEMGRYAAFEQLNFVYKVLVMGMRTEKLLDRVPTMWRTFNDTGRLEVVALGPGMARLRLTDHADPSVVYCRRLRGWMARGVEATGGKLPRVTETHCRSVAGGTSCEFLLEWK